MKKLYFVLIPALFFCINFLANSQTVDDIIQKYTESIGGMDNIKSIKTIKMTGIVAVQGVDLPLTITLKRPDKVRMDVEFQGMKQIQAYDGTTAWQVQFMKGDEAEKMSAEQTENMKMMADFEGIMINYQKKGFTASMLGKEIVDSSETYKLAFTNTSGDSIFSYINTETFLPVKRTRYSKTKDITTSTLTKEYKKFEDVMLPVVLEIKRGDDDDTLQKITFTKVEINADINNDIFRMPEEKGK